MHDSVYEAILETTATLYLYGILDNITDVLKSPQAAQRVFLSIFTAAGNGKLYYKGLLGQQVISVAPILFIHAVMRLFVSCFSVEALLIKIPNRHDVHRKFIVGKV